MAFRNNAYATVWSIEPGRGNFTKCRISTSRKNKETDQYEQDFSGFITMIGQAHAKAQNLRERDRIKLLDIDVTSRYDKERAREYINFNCFDFAMADQPAQSAPAGSGGSVESNPVEGDCSEEDLPF